MRIFSFFGRSHSLAICSLCSALLSIAPLKAQELDTRPLMHAQDLQLWSSVKLSKELVKNLALSIEQGYRRDDNLLNTKSLLTDLALGYKFNKHIDATLGYRYQWNMENHSSRINADVALSKELDRFTISSRSRLQRRFETDANHTDFFRERLKLSYNIKKNPISPFVSLESFYHSLTEETNGRL